MATKKAAPGKNTVGKTATAAKAPAPAAKPAPAKPAPAPAPVPVPKAAAKPAARREPTDSEIRARAHLIWERSGCIAGRDEQNWLQAEAELRAGK